MKKFLFITFILFTLYGCSKEENNEHIIQQLIGNWECKTLSETTGGDIHDIVHILNKVTFNETTYRTTTEYTVINKGDTISKTTTNEGVYNIILKKEYNKVLIDFIPDSDESSSWFAELKGDSILFDPSIVLKKVNAQ